MSAGDFLTKGAVLRRNFTNNSWPWAQVGPEFIANMSIILKFAKMASTKNPWMPWLELFICFLGVLGNTAALWTLYRDKEYQRWASFVYHRAMYWSDLLLISGTIAQILLFMTRDPTAKPGAGPMLITRYTLSPGIPVLLKFSDFLIVIVGIDRVIAMVAPVVYQNRISRTRVSIMVTVITFLVSTPFGIVRLLGKRMAINPKTGKPEPKGLIYTAKTTFYIYGVTPIIVGSLQVVLAMALLHLVRQHGRKRKDRVVSKDGKDDKEGSVIQRLLAALIAIYLVCNVPFMAVMVRYPHGGFVTDQVTYTSSREGIEEIVRDFAEFVWRFKLVHISVLASHSFNFFAYLALSPKFRCAFYDTTAPLTKSFSTVSGSNSTTKSNNGGPTDGLPKKHVWTSNM